MKDNTRKHGGDDDENAPRGDKKANKFFKQLHDGTLEESIKACYDEALSKRGKGMREMVSKVINAAYKRLPGDKSPKHSLAVQIDHPMFKKVHTHEQGKFNASYYYRCIYEEAKTKAGSRADLEEAVKKQRVRTSGSGDFEDLVFSFSDGESL